MLSLGAERQDALDRIWLLDKYRVFTNAASRRGYKHVIQADFLEWETDMKFDVVVGNPPYQDGKSKNTLYPKFYAKAIKLVKKDGVVAMITPPPIIYGLWGLKNPDGIRMPEPRQIEKIVVGDRVKNFFNADSKFCYFVVTNKESDNQNVTIETDAGAVIVNTPLFPVVVASEKLQLAQQIINKCFEFGCDPFNATSGDYGTKAVSDPNGTDLAVESISTKGEIRTRNIRWLKEHPHYGSPKVLMPMYGKVVKVDYSHNLVSAASEKVNGQRLSGHNITTILTKSDQESESVVSLLESKLQVFFNIIQDETRSPYLNFLKNFKLLPLDKPWTDQEIYDAFNLTREEIDYIESNVK